jgi:membrane fusion protein, copper/silver efflux system
VDEKGGNFFIRNWGKLLAVLILLVGTGFLIAYVGNDLIAWLEGTRSSTAKESAAELTIWTCSMHPQVRETKPGRCPICGMDLVPLVNRSNEKTSSTSVPEHAQVMIPGELQQRIGVRIGSVEKGPLDMTVEAMGIVRPDQTRIARVNIKTEGWIDKLFVNFVGQTVGKGDPLLSIYSPQFVSTQQELITALRADRTLGGNQPSLVEAARRRLELWDVPAAEIDQMEKSGKVQTDLVLRSPIAGTVLEQNVYEKQYVTPEKVLYVIGDLSVVWVQAQVYEYEIPHVEIGRPAAVTIPSLPDRKFAGKVVFIQPTVEEMTRTVQVRIELPNREGIFKPGMFAQISIAHPMGEGLLVPVSAVLRTGERDLVYRVLPNDHFSPVAVKISPIQFGDRFQVLEGLKEGEKIVTSANFLIDSESRIQFSRGDAGEMHP